MKISCQSCAAKYTIADEKVVGKVIKIKCKKCSSTIVVNGNDPATLAQLQGQAQGDSFEDQAQTQLVSSPPGFGGGGDAAPPPDEWTVSVSDDDQRTMTTAQVLTEYAKGTLTADTYLWRDGMADWLPIHQVPELAPLLAASGAPTSGNGTAAYASDPHAGGYHEQPSAAAAAAASTAAAAARRSSGRQSVDLFGSDGGARPSAGGGGGGGLGAAGLTQPMSSDKHIGERNETSVLFSLKDLAAAEAAATTKPAQRSGGGSSSFNSAKNDRVDDFLSLGSISAAPMLAPPAMNAPWVEPPPPPPPPSVAPIAAAMPTPMMYAQPQKKSPVPYIVGGIGALALIGGIIFFVAGSGGDKTSATSDTAKTEKSDKTEKSAEAKSTDTSKTADPSKSADTAVASTATTSEPTSEPTSSASATPSGKTDPTKVATTDKKDPKKDDPKKEDPKKEDPKKEDPVKEEPAGKGGDAPFDRGAASAAMSGAAGRAAGCKKADGPTGSTKVQVTFQPSGKGTAPSVGAPFAGTPVGSCIAGAFKGLSIPPFSGSPVPVSKTVTIR